MLSVHVFSSKPLVAAPGYSPLLNTVPGRGGCCLVEGTPPPQKVEATLSLADPDSSRMSQSVHLTPSGVEGGRYQALSAPQTPQLPSSACRPAVRGGWWCRTFSYGSSFLPASCLGRNTEVIFLHLQIPHPIVVVKNSRGAGCVETEPQR